MNFFTLQVLSTSRGALYESDIEPNGLRYFARVIAGELVRHKFFSQGEQFSMRLLPRWAGTHSQDFRLVDSRELPPRTDRFIDLVFEEPVLPDPISFLTVRWHSDDRPLVYQQDFSVHAVFESVIQLVVTNLMQKQTLTDGEDFKVHVFARNQGLPTIDPDLLPRVTTSGEIEVSVPQRPADIPGGGGEPPDTTAKPRVSITGRRSLVTPIPKRPQEYPMLEVVRDVKPGALEVYVERSTWLRLREAAKPSVSQQVEVAGALVGGVFTDEAGQIFVEVSDILPTPEAQGSFYSVKMDSEIWRGVIERVNLQYPDRTKVLVGWYHTHLISKLQMTSTDKDTGELRASRRTFLSSDDVYIHDNFFTQPWHVALVVDLSLGQDVFFYRKGKDLVDPGGFFLFGKTAAS